MGPQTQQSLTCHLTRGQPRCLSESLRNFNKYHPWKWELIKSQYLLRTPAAHKHACAHLCTWAHKHTILYVTLEYNQSWKPLLRTALGSVFNTQKLYEYPNLDLLQTLLETSLLGPGNTWVEMFLSLIDRELQNHAFLVPWISKWINRRGLLHGVLCSSVSICSCSCPFVGLSGKIWDTAKEVLG